MNDLYQFIDFLIPGDNKSSFDPKSVSKSDIRAWLNNIGLAGDSARTIRRKTQSIRSFFKYLLIINEIDINPASGIILAKIEKPLPEFIREDEMESVLTSIDIACNETKKAERRFVFLRNKLIMTMLYTTGIRQAELLGIKDSDINRYSKEIRVIGKRDKQRIIPISDELINDIDEYLTARNSLFPTTQSGNHLFTIKDKAMTQRTLYNIVHQNLSTTSSNKKSPHVLRHTFATSMLNNGADINSVKEFLGHTSLATTQVYTHISFAELKRSYDSAHPRGENANDKK
jgi:integrase/recombinase XerC